MIGKRVVIAANWLGWFSVFLIRFAPSPVLILIEKSFNLTHGEASLIFTSYLLAYAVMQIPAGVLSDRISPSRVIAAGLAIMTISGFAMGLSPTFVTMILLSFLTGMGAGTFYTSSTSLLSLLFPPREREKVLGIVYSGIGAGTSVAIAVGGFLGSLLGWRGIFFILAIPGAISAILFTRIRIPDPNKPRRSGFSSLGLEILRIRTIAICIVIHALMLVTYFGITSFTPTYIAISIGKSLVEAGLLFLVFPLSEIFGGLVGGYIASRIGSKSVLMISLISISIGTAAIPFTRSVFHVVPILSMIGLMFRAAATALPLIVVESTPRHVLGAILGWYNSIGFVGASIGPYTFGYIADLHGFLLSYIALSLFPLVSVVLLRMLKTGYVARNI
ncbi:MAG TPA: MFS transporter [Sulfolobales archaeon]|nr:MFS transporter [Sulfolobales archaeon]